MIIYPLLTNGIPIGGNTYSATLKPLITLQMTAIDTVTFSKPDEHFEPFFKELDILKLTDLVTLHSALLMYLYQKMIEEKRRVSKPLQPLLPPYSK